MRIHASGYSRDDRNTGTKVHGDVPMKKKLSNKQPAAATGATDSAAATAALFAPEKIAASIGKVEWSGRDDPCWPLPQAERKSN